MTTTAGSTTPVVRNDQPGGGRGGSRRLDVEGVRGVAIALVVVFHVYFGVVSGGVDGFLAISGLFFFTSLVKFPGGRSLAGRLWRVLRRLLPPMALAITGTILMVWAWLPPSQLVPVATEGLWSMIFGQNWYLSSQGDEYGSASATASPLQHLWSMAIQGQIFLGATLVFATVGYIIHRFAPAYTRRVLVWMLVVMTGLSLSYATFSAWFSPGSVYYDTFARLWEIGLGGIVGIVALRAELPRWLREVIGVIGLAMMLIPGLLLDGGEQFPGIPALVPVLGVMAVILAGNGMRPALVTRLMLTRPLQFVGSHAYALYLWHWPILITYIGYRATRGESDLTPESLSIIEGLGIIALSLAVAWVTGPLIEKDFGRWYRNLHWAVAVMAAVALAASVVVYQGHRTETLTRAAGEGSEQYPGSASVSTGTPAPDGVPLAPPLSTAVKDLPASSRDGCFDGPEGTGMNVCQYGDPDGTYRIVLAGGSHAEQWLPALDRIARDSGARIETVFKAGCPLGADSGHNLDLSNEYEDCIGWQANVMDWITQTSPDLVITNSTRPEGPGLPDFTPPQYIAAFEAMDAAGIEVIGIRDNPWIVDDAGEPVEVPECLDTGDAESCGMARDKALAPVDPAPGALAHLPLFRQIDMSDHICGPDYCEAVYGNVLVYRDSHHMTSTYVKTMTEVLRDRLAEVVSWIERR